MLRVDKASVREVLVDHVLFRELQVEVVGALVFLVEDFLVNFKLLRGGFHLI